MDRFCTVIRKWLNKNAENAVLKFLKFNYMRLFFYLFVPSLYSMLLITIFLSYMFQCLPHLDIFSGQDVNIEAYAATDGGVVVT